MLAVATTTNKLETYAINADGSLAAVPMATIATTRNALSLLTYAPDQPPIADLTASRAGSTAHFDARASEAVNGTIARYDWTFGDGTVLVDGGAAPTHTYPGLGDYTATVTLTDGVGCSTAETFTGVMSICAGSPDAATSMVVHVTAAAPPVSPPPPAAPAPSEMPLAPDASPAEAPCRPPFLRRSSCRTP